MQVRFLTLTAPELFTVLGTAVDVAIKNKIEDVSIGPFDDRLLVTNGVWLSGSDTEVAKLISGMEAALDKDGVQYVWAVDVQLKSQEAEG